MRILVIEDDAEVARQIAAGLRERGHAVDGVDEGPAGLERASSGAYDALVLDRMLPGLDGVRLIERLRAAGDRTPVLILSALGEIDDRVRGLEAGGDDYLTKPFALSELAARLEALVRRSREGSAQTLLRIGDLELDLLRRNVRRGGEAIALQPREFALLEYLVRHAGQVVTRAMLLEHVWGYHFDPQTNVIDVHISRLRSKLDRGHGRPLIRTVRGAGYALAAGED